VTLMTASALTCVAGLGVRRRVACARSTIRLSPKRAGACVPLPPRRSRGGEGTGWGAFDMRRERLSDAHASRQGAAIDDRYRGGTAPHPYPPRRFAGEGERSAMIASLVPYRGGSGASAKPAPTIRAGADVPLPPRRRSGGEGTGGGRSR